MTTKIDIRSTLASLAFVSALVLGGATAFAPSASAELTPPPFPGTEELPAPPQNESAPPPAQTVPAPTADGGSAAATPVAVPSKEVESHEEARVLRVRMTGQKLALSLQCSSSGTVGLEGGASQHFQCRAGKGSAAVKLSAKQRQRGNGTRGLRVAVVLHTGGSTIRVPLVIRRSSTPMTASASATSPYWNYVDGQCVSYGSGGGKVRVETNTFNDFGTAPGETVYWRSYLYAYVNGSWHAVPNGWETYTVSSFSSANFDENYTIIGGGVYSYMVEQIFNIAPRTWTLTGVQVWTRSTGYRFAWVNNNNGGYGNVYSQNGYCYTV